MRIIIGHTSEKITRLYLTENNDRNLEEKETISNSFAAQQYIPKLITDALAQRIERSQCNFLNLTIYYISSYISQTPSSII
jgi:hypothetical protein